VQWAWNLRWEENKAKTSSYPSLPQHWDQKSGHSLPAALRASSQRKDFMEVRRSSGLLVLAEGKLRPDGVGLELSALPLLASLPLSLPPCLPHPSLSSVALGCWSPCLCPICSLNLPLSWRLLVS
jgi:hypothetical protein